MERRVPQVGEVYFPQFESDWSFDEPNQLLAINRVDDDYEDGGFMILASDGVGYDCYWSAKIGMWCYSLS